MLGRDDRAWLWPMIRGAAGFLVRDGPVTPQDRWEEEPGYSPFTLSAMIAALLVAAERADAAGEPSTAAFLRETADVWNGNLERWTYVEGGAEAERAGVRGYFRRATSPAMDPSAHSRGGRTEEGAVSVDALALVRFGLRPADDPRVVPTGRLRPGAQVRFTLRWREDGRWQGEDFAVRVGEGG